MSTPTDIKPALQPVETATPSSVLVTGVTGYIAASLVERLLAAGHTVHGTVRDVAKATPLLAVLPGASERLKLFKADLLKPDGFKEAMQGCSIVFHVASPVIVGNGYGAVAQRTLVDPAVQGTANVLNAVNEVPSVKRVVLTSSIASVYHTGAKQAPGSTFTEADWNRESTLYDLPYNLSKRLAEEKAWEIANQQKRWDMVVMNPGFVWGPPAIASCANTASLSLLIAVFKSEFSTIYPVVGMEVVDVRDVVKAHMLAAFTPSANGRNILVSHSLQMRDYVTLAAELFPKRVKKPFLPLPKWFAVLAGPLLGLPRDFVRAQFGYSPRCSTDKVKRELGMEFLPLTDMLVDTESVLSKWKVL